MKKKLLAVLISIALVSSFAGCGQTCQEAVNNNAQEEYLGDYFIEITEWTANGGKYRIVYANDTKVKYLVVMSAYHFGITPLYNADGTLQIYEGAE